MTGAVRAALLAGLLLLAGGAQAGSPETMRPETGRGWQEAVLSVRAFAPIRDFMVAVAGYEVIDCGAVDPALLAAWGVPEAAGASYELLRSPGKAVGWVRLVRFDGVEQEIMRPGAQAWDQGGLFSLMVRAADASDVMDAAHARGWSVFNRPQVFDFGPLVIKNVVVRLPDGINLAVYSRVAPPVEGWDDLAGFSYPFNAMGMVHDIGEERRFLEEGLGFSPFWEGDYLDPEPVDTNFALPDNLADDIPRRTAILQQRPGEDGRLELMQFVGLDGQDFSARAKAPNLGILSVRLPVADMDAALDRLAQAGFAAAGAPVRLTLPPYGAVDYRPVRSPAGIQVDLFRPLRH